jgi:uncharacterized DUF497 family protein
LPRADRSQIESKHHVTFSEARHILFSHPRIRFAEKGHTAGEDGYAAFGQTLGGRYLSVFFIYKPKSRTAVIISARDMSNRERKAYGRNKLSNISKADSDEKMGEFWDTHDLTEFDSDAPDAEFEVTCMVPVRQELLSEIEKQAAKRGVKVDDLVNLWLQQKLDEGAA